jgi:hypothetical protein
MTLGMGLSPVYVLVFVPVNASSYYDDEHSLTGWASANGQDFDFPN